MSLTLLGVLALLAGLAALRRRRRPPEPEEPWRRSLEDDEPLDLEEIRRAEEEFLAGGVEEDFDEDDGEPWRDR